MPIAYEFAVELSFPLPEALSAGLMSQFNNIAGMIFLFVIPCIPTNVINVMYCGTIAICIPLVYFFVDEKYERANEEDILTHDVTPQYVAMNDTLKL